MAGAGGGAAAGAGAAAAAAAGFFLFLGLGGPEDRLIVKRVAHTGHAGSTERLSSANTVRHTEHAQPTSTGALLR